MKVPSGWLESKFVVHPGTGVLRASRNPYEVCIDSRLVTDRIGAFYTRAIQEHAHGKLLDLGCGRAPLLNYYAGFVESATLVDWGNSFHENPMLDLVADLNLPLDLNSDYFDTVILSDVLEHIAEPQTLMGEISRVLRFNGGVLLLTVPFFYPIHEEPFDFQRYTNFSLARMCSKAGLEVIDISPIGGLPEIIIDITSKISRQLPFVGRGIAAVVQALGSFILKRRIVRHVSERTATRFPLGYSLVAVKSND